MKLLEAVEKALESAPELQEGKAVAAVEALRHLAAQIDADPSHAANTTYPTFLKYLDALNLLPDEAAQEKTSSAKVAKFARYSRAG